jgi:short-subunit dehydrogenase
MKEGCAMPLRGEHLVVTGGSGGIGAPLCHRLVDAGADVTILSRSQPAVDGCEWHPADLSDPAGIQAACDWLAQQPVSRLVLAAGQMYCGPLSDAGAQSTTAMLHLNLLAPMLLTQAVLPDMRRSGGGQIVAVGSILGSINLAYFTGYSATKAGLRGYTQALRREVAADGIDVTYVAPRAVRTPMSTGPVAALAEKTGMAMDDPQQVAERIFQAMLAREKDVYLGFPEKLFVRINALLPRLVDKATAKDTAIAASLFHA